MSELKLLLIGASVFQSDNEGRLTSKGLVVDYVQGFSQWFDKVIWATSVFTGEAHTQTVVDTSKVLPCIVGGKMRHLLSDYFTLRSLVDKKTVIFLHLPNPWLTIVALALKRRARGFFVYVANDYIQHSEVSRQTRGMIYSKLYRFIHELPIRLADGVIARGKLNLERALRLNPNVIETVPIGLNTVHCKRTREPFSENSIKILYVGKLMEGKGVDVLLRAFSRLCREISGKDLSLIIVGTGFEEHKLKSMSSVLGVAEKVRFIGFVDDKQKLSALYADADVLVVPSIYPEAVPRVIDEALLHGTPVIASELEGIRRQFSEGEVILVPPGDVVALGNAIFRLIDNHSFRRDVIKIVKNNIEKRNRQTASDQHAEFILKGNELMKFYESQEYINRRKSTAHLRKIESVDLFSGKTVLEIGCGANPQDHLGHEYIGIDISFMALKESLGRGWRIQADARYLPFKDGSFDAVITIALLEHIPDPERVLCEIARVLRTGGIVMHCDAWNVPPWRSLGLHVKPYSMLNFWHKVLKFLLPLLESLPLRVLRVIPRRLIRELMGINSLDYYPLSPNYNLPEASDADACSSIDSHSVLLFYKSLGFDLINPVDKFLNRILHRGFIITRKK